jgi:hypothetical protein
MDPSRTLVVSSALMSHLLAGWWHVAVSQAIMQDDKRFWGIPLSRQGQSSLVRVADLTALPQMPTILWYLESEPWYRIDADERQHICTSKEERTP